MTDETLVRHQGSFYVDEGYISSDMSSPPAQNNKNKKRNHHPNTKSINPKFTPHSEASSLAQLNESLMQELSVMHVERHHLVVKIDQLEDELHTMDLKNEALMLEIRDVGAKFHMVNEETSKLHDEIKQQRHKSNRDLGSILQRAQDTEKAMEGVIRSLEKLRRELEQVTSDGQPDSEKPESGGRTMEQELQRLSDAVVAAKLRMIDSKKLLKALQEEKKSLEAALNTSQQQKMEVEEQEARIADNISNLNSEIKSITQPCKEQKNSPDSPAIGVEGLSAGARLEKDWNELRDSVWKLLGDYNEKQLQISKLEGQLFASGDNKKALEQDEAESRGAERGTGEERELHAAPSSGAGWCEKKDEEEASECFGLWDPDSGCIDVGGCCWDVFLPQLQKAMNNFCRVLLNREKFSFVLL